jgi:glycosyltransferase involved in cell wall biosynthesis
MMRILIANWSRRRAGGTETYLEQVMVALAGRGHDLAFCFEVDEPEGRPAIQLTGSTFSVRLRPDLTGSIEQLGKWKPDVSYVHGLLDPDTEARLLDVAPAVLAAHSYYGTCISGEKTHKFPIVQPCGRRFGAACLALYFPRRCGGLSPVSMMTAYGRQRRRLALLDRYAAVVTPSEHMHREFVRHDAARGRVYTLPHGIDVSVAPPSAREASGRLEPGSAVRLMLIGRLDRLKGGRALLDALPRVRTIVGRPLRLTFAGVGPAGAAWEHHARSIARAHADLSIEFAGWLQPDALTARLAATDVVVMPSLWPEPFGLAGLEANRLGVPVVAYATGGIPEWLRDGVNGCLAPGNPPTVRGLADALVRCVRSLESGDDLTRGAIAAARAHDDRRHVDALLDILERAAAGANRLSA